MPSFISSSSSSVSFLFFFGNIFLNLISLSLFLLLSSGTFSFSSSCSCSLKYKSFNEEIWLLSPSIPNSSCIWSFGSDWISFSFDFSSSIIGSMDSPLISSTFLSSGLSFKNPFAIFLTKLSYAFLSFFLFFFFLPFGSSFVSFVSSWGFSLSSSLVCFFISKGCSLVSFCSSSFNCSSLSQTFSLVCSSSTFTFSGVLSAKRPFAIFFTSFL